jgi:YegS/Rv2252/BmrU family lipid kinase
VTPRLAITNATAGGAEHEAVSAALDVLRADGPLQVESTASAQALDRVLAAVQRSDDGDDPVVVVVGGDGSLHALMNALHRSGHLDRTWVGLIPLGTGNDFARGVGISLNATEAAEQHVNGTPHPIDVLVDDRDALTINAVHLGVGAEAGREAAAWKRRLGRLGYVVGAIKAGATAPGLRLQVTLDGRRLKRTRGIMHVGISNAAFIGGGAELAPDADPGDGKADVTVSYANAPLQRLGYALRLRRGEHGERDDVVTGRASLVHVEGEEFCINSDGEISGPYRSLGWELRRGAATMLLPAG